MAQLRAILTKLFLRRPIRRTVAWLKPTPVTPGGTTRERIIRFGAKLIGKSVTQSCTETLLQSTRFPARDIWEVVHATSCDMRPRGDSGHLVCAVVVIVAAVVAGIFAGSEVRNIAVSFDGGMNVQSAVSLVEDGRYATRYRGLNDFDHRVTTGPTVVLPVAVAYWLLGPGNTVYQLPNLAYFIALFALAAVYAHRHAGPVAAGLTVLLFMATPRLLDLGLRVYGEVPATAFVLAALLLLDRDHSSQSRLWAWLVGLFLGLAVLTKIMMVIPIAGIGLVLLWKWLGRRALQLRSVLALVGGFVGPHLLWEIAKLMVLSPPVYLEWWEVMVRRSFSHGTAYGMANTVHGLIKPSKHLHLLAFKLHEPFWIVALLVSVPFVLLVVLVVRNRRPGSWRLPLSTEAMAAAVAVQLGWWLLLSPTGNSWLRRALSGILLLELLASIVLVWSTVWIWRRARAGPAREPRVWIAAVVGLAACLAVTLAAFVHHSPTTFRPRNGPTIERRATEALADRVRALPADATIYAIGWYEAPVVSALTARQIHDIEALPIDRYRTSLAHSYLVVDSHLLGNRPDAVEAVLRRSTAELLWEQWRCRLFRLDSIGPYAPIPEAETIDDLLAVYRPTAHPDYPFVGGLSEQHELRALSRAVSGPPTLERTAVLAAVTRASGQGRSSTRARDPA